jgi:hypothetical protein
MKTTIAIITTAMLLGACASGDGMMRLGRNCPAPKAGEVPSGCQVKGHGAYFMTHGGEIVQIANVKSTRNILRTTREPNLSAQ